MADRNGFAGHGARIAQLALWTGAGIVVLTAHVGAAVWFLREQPAVSADETPPPAIMIELAPDPEAVATEENEIAPDQEAVEQSIAQPDEITEPDASADVPPEDASEPEPAPVEKEFAEEEPVTEPVDEPIAAQVENVEVPIPTPRPQRPQPKKEVATKPPKEPEPVRKSQRQQLATTSKAAVQAQARVKESNRTAARQTSSGLFSSSMTPAKWQSRLMAHLERRKRYPSGARRRGEQGVAYVRFRIDGSGNVLSVSLARSSGFAELDQAVLSLVRRASPVPAPPPGVNKTITAPVQFSIR